MTCCSKSPVYGCRAPSFRCVEPEQAILFMGGISSAHRHEPRCAPDRESFSCIDEIPSSEFGIADPGYAAMVILMRPVAEAEVAFQ